MPRILDLLFGVALATPVSLLLYLSLSATPFGGVAAPLAIASWVGLIYEIVKRRNGNG